MEYNIVTSILRENYRSDSLIFEGQFGFTKTVNEIPKNATLEDLWTTIAIQHIIIAEKAYSLSSTNKYKSRLSVIHDADVSIQPIYSYIVRNARQYKWIGSSTWIITVHSSHDNETRTKVKTTSEMIEFFNIDSLTKDYNYKYDETVISITQLLNKQQNQITLHKLYQCLSTNGWCFIEYPQSDFDIIQPILSEIRSFMKDNNNDHFYNKYYYEYLYYKRTLHIFTGDIFDVYQYKYPLPILKELRILSNIVDKLSMDIMNALYDDIFGLNTMNGFKEYNITLLNDPHNIHGLRHRSGMLDFVLYHNQEEGNKLNVIEHTDPGLFSLSFGSDNLGLQMFDIKQSKWINVPNDYGVLWCGEIASKITNNDIKSGIHRVVQNANNKQPRFTAWFEVCVNDQIWPMRFDDIWRYIFS